MNKKDRLLVVKKYRELGRQTKVAKALGISQSTVSTALREEGIKIGRGGPQTKYDHAKMFEMWNDGLNIKQIATRIGSRKETVRYALQKKFGISTDEMRMEHPWKYDLPMDELAERYRKGETCGDIARSIDIPSERVRRRLKAHGVKIRSAAESVPQGKKNRFYKNGNGKVEPMHYYRRQCYEVVAICLGQPVPRGAVIHHIDENPKNNNPENLILFPSVRKHSKFHQKLLGLQQKGLEADTTQMALESGGRQLSPPHPLEIEPYTDRRGPSSKKGKKQTVLPST